MARAKTAVKISKPVEKVVSNTLKQRGAIYGEFIDNAIIAQGLKDVVRKEPRFQTMPADQREAIDVIFSKIARQITGDYSYDDNFHDIQGYAKLCEDRILTTPSDEL